MRPSTSVVVRFESSALQSAERAAEELRARLALRGSHAHVESGTRGLPGTTLVVGVRDASDDETEPRWLAPLLVRDEPRGAADDALAFLERWSFIGRPADGPARRVALT
jgi:hypothetical protein